MRRERRGGLWGDLEEWTRSEQEPNRRWRAHGTEGRNEATERWVEGLKGNLWILEWWNFERWLTLLELSFRG